MKLAPRTGFCSAGFGGSDGVSFFSSDFTGSAGTSSFCGASTAFFPRFWFSFFRCLCLFFLTGFLRWPSLLIKACKVDHAQYFQGRLSLFFFLKSNFSSTAGGVMTSADFQAWACCCRFWGRLLSFRFHLLLPGRFLLHGDELSTQSS